MAGRLAPVYERAIEAGMQRDVEQIEADIARMEAEGAGLTGYTMGDVEESVVNANQPQAVVVEEPGINWTPVVLIGLGIWLVSRRR